MAKVEVAKLVTTTATTSKILQQQGASNVA